MKYLTRDASQPPEAIDLRSKWTEVDALRVVQSALTRDIVDLRRAVDVAPSLASDLADHEASLALISAKLVKANLAFYELRDHVLHAPQPAPGHGHGHSH